MTTENAQETEVYARLIAAAPELLAIVQAVAEDVAYDDEGNEGYWEGGLFYPEPSELVVRARAAIAKATQH